jgi:hypothetical protein
MVASAHEAGSSSRSLLDYFAITRSVLFNQFLACAEAGDRAGVAYIAAKLLDVLREHGRITGELRQLSGVTINNNTLNIISSPEFLRLQDGLLRIARAHPEVRVELMKLVHNLTNSI